MKKRILALLMAGTLVMAMGITGCGNKGAAPAGSAGGETESVGSSAAEENEPETPAMEGASGEETQGESVGDASAALMAQVPLAMPPELTSLKTVEAEPWLQISDTNPGVEGPAFDEEGNLYICDTSPVVPENHILKIDKDKKIEPVWTGTDDPEGLAFDKDGKLFAACRNGNVLSMNKDGSDLEVITPAYEGKPLSYNDLVFSPEGNIYITDWRGTIVDPIGGVYMLTKESGFKEAVPVVSNLASPNGISLSPDGSVMWIGCTMSNNVLKITLAGEGKVADLLGIVPVYYNTGSDGPDSNKTDSAGNMYQAFMPGGRLLVFDCNGTPIQNIIVPERAEGKLTMSSNLIIKPGTTEGYLFTADFGSGAWIYRFDALAEGK